MAQNFKPLKRFEHQAYIITFIFVPNSSNYVALNYIIGHIGYFHRIPSDFRRIPSLKQLMALLCVRSSVSVEP